MNKQESIDFIARYFADELSEEENISFLKKIKDDKQFTRWTNNYLQVSKHLNDKLKTIEMEKKENIFEEIDDSLLSRMRGWDKKLKEDAESAKRQKIFSFITLSIIIVLSIVWFLNSYHSKDTYSKTSLTTEDSTKTFIEKENNLAEQYQDSNKQKTDIQEKNKIQKETPKNTISENNPNTTEVDLKNFEVENYELDNMASQADDGSNRGSKFKINLPKNKNNFDKEVFYEWENENRKEIYTLQILDRYGERVGKTHKIQCQEPLVTFRLNLSLFEPALYYWKLEHTSEEIPMYGKFFVKKPN